MNGILVYIGLLGCKDEASSTVQISRSPSQEQERDWSAGEDGLGIEWLARASLDIRGYRPTPEELGWAEQNPDNITDILDSWLSEPAFARQMAWYWNDLLQTAVWIGQEQRFDSMYFTLEEEQAIGWEPLAYIEQTILSDAPFTNIVTTDSVPTNEALASVFADDSELTDWGMHQTLREHPAAGVLGSRVLWTRHFVDFLNHNRARANYYSATFLCQDYLERDVAFDFSQVSLDNVETAIQTQSECVTCHASLDPLASVFGAFQENINLAYDQQGVASSFKQRWYAGLTEPSYFGLPLNNLSELGAYTASDARFSQCMVEHTWNFFVESVEIDDLDKIDLANIFIQSDYSIKQLVEHIVQSPEYARQSSRVLRPEQLLETLAHMSQVDDDDPVLSQLVWSPEHRVLFGSIDNLGVLTANPAFTVGHHLTLEWLTKELSNVLESDLSTQSFQNRTLLTEMNSDTPLERQRQILHWKQTLHSDPVSDLDAEVTALVNLWNNVNDDQGELSAWSTVLAVLLHDPRAVLR